MTQRAPADADAGRPPLVLLFLPYVTLVLAAAATPTSALFSDQGDVKLYLEKAVALAAGQVPYREFPFEYPPLALIPMVVPSLLWPFGGVTVEVYKWLFVGWEAVLVVGLGLVLGQVTWLRQLGGGAASRAVAAGEAATGALRDKQRWLGIRLVILTAGAALAIAFRFDLFPALLAMVGLWAALAGRPALAGVAIAAGVLAKLYPAALVPALAVAWLVPLDLRALRRYGLAIVGTLAAVLLPFLAMAGPAALGFLSYQARRGLQIESVGGGLVLLDGLLRGQPVHIVAPFSAAEASGPLADAWLVALPVLTVVAFGGLAWLGWRRIRAEGIELGRVQPATVVALTTASLLVLIATSKVFSIQYVVWIVPFAALLSGARFWLAGAMVALTMPIHPLLYDELVAQEAVPVLMLNARNVLLLALTGWLLWDLRPGRVSGMRDAAGGPAAERNEGDVARPAGLEPTTFRSAT